MTWGKTQRVPGNFDMSFHSLVRDEQGGHRIITVRILACLQQNMVILLRLAGVSITAVKRTAATEVRMKCEGVACNKKAQLVAVFLPPCWGTPGAGGGNLVHFWGVLRWTFSVHRKSKVQNQANDQLYFVAVCILVSRIVLRSGESKTTAACDWAVQTAHLPNDRF